MDLHAWTLIGALTLAAYASGLTLYWAALQRQKARTPIFWAVAAAALGLHALILALTKGQLVLHALVVLPGLAVLVSAWLQRRRPKSG